MHQKAEAIRFAEIIELDKFRKAKIMDIKGSEILEIISKFNKEHLPILETLNTPLSRRDLELIDVEIQLIKSNAAQLSDYFDSALLKFYLDRLCILLALIDRHREICL